MQRNHNPVPIPQWIRDFFPPDQRAAVDCLRKMVDEGMLREIAEADYAQHVEEHLRTLLPIWNGDELGEMGTWYPMEVLELIRWSEPDDPDHKPSGMGLRGHQMRAFACAVLLATPNFEVEKTTLIQLIESVLLLGPEAQTATAQYLVWIFKNLDYEDDRPCFALALAYFVLSLYPSLPASLEDELAEWVVKVEATERDYQDSEKNAHWPVGLSLNGRHDEEWFELIQQILESYADRPFARMIEKYHLA